MKHCLYILTTLFVMSLLSCSAPERSGTYPQFIRAVVIQDEKYLWEFKNQHELDWGTDWKLMSSVIEPHTKTVEIDGKTATEPDTGCIVEWIRCSAGNEGVIRRERYMDDESRPTIESYYFRGDSVYAWSTTDYVTADRHEKLVTTQYFSRAWFCDNAASKSYAALLEELRRDTLDHPVYRYEYAFYDGNGELSGQYFSSEIVAWSFSAGASGISASLTSNAIIITEKQSPFVTINAPQQ